jgi:protein-L-isoaspartate(D-aspartate) O-methyltransferase
MTDSESASQLERARLRMLELIRENVRSERVLSAMATVPRARFVPEGLRSHAYDDSPLPIGEGQTISQPLIVGMMVELLELQPDDRVLEVGTGSGYQAAVLSRLAREVVTVERLPELCDRAAATLTALEYENVHVYAASETLGRPEDAPYDAIVVAAGAPHVPRALLDQLAPGGRLVIPVGDRSGQELVRARKTAHGVELERLGPCAFVPLIGEDAWASFDAGRGAR